MDGCEGNWRDVNAGGGKKGVENLWFKKIVEIMWKNLKVFWFKGEDLIIFGCIEGKTEKASAFNPNTKKNTIRNSFGTKNNQKRHLAAPVIH